MSHRRYNFWVLAEAADDVPGQWTAHVLELDIVTQGTSRDHVLKMAAEATLMTLLDDVKAGRDPLERRAPEECWTPLWALIQNPKSRPIESVGAEETQVDKFAAQLIADIELAEERATEPNWKVPAAWALREAHA